MPSSAKGHPHLFALILLILFCAFFIQSLTGFGSALIAMPLLVSLIGIDKAAPMFALVAQVAGLGMLFRYRKEWDWRSVWRVALGAIFAVPIGIWGAQQINERLAMLLLGILTLTYALYALSGIGVPKAKQSNPQWAFGIGAASGLLHGAYNTGGPPLVMYGNSQQWSPPEFKANVQSLFFINGVLAISTHALSGRINSDVLLHFLVAIPVVFIAQKIGFSLDKYINPALFRKGVLILLVIIGIQLIF
jgi:uncharacterized membrane protein YfcA